jgi:hypothetical protein
VFAANHTPHIFDELFVFVTLPLHLYQSEHGLRKKCQRNTHLLARLPTGARNPGTRGITEQRLNGGRGRRLHFHPGCLLPTNSSPLPLLSGGGGGERGPWSSSPRCDGWVSVSPAPSRHSGPTRPTIGSVSP